jgi:hypothetical protein
MYVLSDGLKKYWIDAKTLPHCNEPDTPVLICTRKGNIMIGLYLQDMQRWSDYEAMRRNENQFVAFRFDEVTHWMPLPAAPDISNK